MIWAILALLGVPLWLCAAGILILFRNNRSLRKRAGDLPVRVLPPGRKRWTRAHALWVGDVFAWRASPAAWTEGLVQVVDASPRSATRDEQDHLHRLGADPVIAVLQLPDGTPLEVASSVELGPQILGPFAAANESP
jgi:hypothetical protein